MAPIVSLCMPHLNSGDYVHERMRSILAQTLEDWELIVVDSQSDDGSLAVIEEFARRDSRISVHQAPRDGIYSNINRAIERAQGRYIYLATSDDTMEPRCLELMVAALEAHPECGVAHCCLSIIDEQGHPVPQADAWENYHSQRFFGPWLGKWHVRRAPHDGLLYFRHFTVFTSLTQLLVRRATYREVGLFPTDCGSHADFAWGLRVGLTQCVIHVPQALATWRRHERQATQRYTQVRTRASGEFVRLGREAIVWLKSRDPVLARRIRKRQMLRHYCADEIEARMALARRPFERMLSRMLFVARHPAYVLRRLLGAHPGGTGAHASASIREDIRALMPAGGLVETFACAQKTASPRQAPFA